VKKQILLLILIVVSASSLYAEELEPLPSDPYFAPFKPVKAPVTRGLLPEKGDRLAICGDSITEQKKYSRIMETYLTVCVPELKITVRQYGWGGKVAPFFRNSKADRYKVTWGETARGYAATSWVCFGFVFTNCPI
jgi:hypothetical protein